MLSPNRLFNNLDIHPVSQASGDTATEELPSNTVAAQATEAPEAEQSSLTDFGILSKSLSSDVLLNIFKKLPLPDLKTVKLTSLGGRNLADLVLLEKPVSLRVDSHNLEAIKSGTHPYKGPISLDFSGCRNITDEDFALIVQNNPNIAELNLSHCRNLTDAGLQHLARLPKLQNLNLQGCRITDAGLESLAYHPNLQSLNLAGCFNITDAVLQHLARLPKLQSLNLQGCRITDAGLESLAYHPNLQSLNLAGCFNITDAGLQHLARIPNLQSLDLAGWPNIRDAGLQHLARLHITDAGLQHLARLPKLQSLNLQGCTRITDAGLQHLARFPKLQSLDLQDCTHITNAGVEQLLQHLPHLTIIRPFHLLNLDLRSFPPHITDAGLQHLARLPRP